MPHLFRTIDAIPNWAIYALALCGLIVVITGGVWIVTLFRSALWSLRYHRQQRKYRRVRQAAGLPLTDQQLRATLLKRYGR
jgi:hypothetical protein